MLTHLPDWSVSLEEIWLQVGVKQVACDALNGVINGQYMDALAILHVRALRSKHTQPDAT
jgi:hypothetical protein